MTAHKSSVHVETQKLSIKIHSKYTVNNNMNKNIQTFKFFLGDKTPKIWPQVMKIYSRPDFALQGECIT